MRLNRLLALGSVLAVSACLANGARADSFVGYSGDKADNAYVGNTPVTMDAATARSGFLGELSGYYYEDFQEISSSMAGKTFAKLGLSTTGYTFQWKSTTLNLADAPVGTLTTGDSTNTIFRTGPVGAARGAFGTYDSTLTSATGGTLSDATNSYVDITPGKTDFDVTINIAPGMDAIGLMLNDILQPNKTHVIVNFLDGQSVDESDNLGAYSINAKTGALVPTTLSNNNDFFLGVVGSTPISSITIDEEATGTPICLDNIYVGNVANPSFAPPTVPLPASALAGGTLLGLLAIGRRAIRARND
ncbi:MAG TPA: hypothetical protein VGG19_08500 [Tepidisphaeraceae bacterium]|jgi:hypothetical protein